MMSFKKIVRIMSVVTLTTLSASAFAQASFPAGSSLEKIQQRGKLVVGAGLNSLMFGMKNPMTGSVEGFEADIAREIAKKITGSEKNIEWVTTSPENRIPFVENHRVDMVIGSLTITDPRKKVVSFAGPYYLAGQDMLVQAGNKTINSIKDVDGKKVCILTGTTVEANVRPHAPNIQVVNFSDVPQCVEAVVDGRVDVYVDDGAVLAGSAIRQPEKLRLVGQPFTQEPYGIALAHDDKVLREFITNELQAMIDDGRWMAFYKANLEKNLGQAQIPQLEK